MAQTKVEGGVCRIRMALPSNQSGVTIGSGCLVRSRSFLSYFPPEETQSESMLTNDVFLITSREVFSAAKGDLNSNTSLTAEFLDGKDGKLSSFPLDVVRSRDLPGRVLGLGHCQTTYPGHYSYSQFTVIPVEYLDRRNKLHKKLITFSLARKGRPLNCRRENEGNLMSLLATRQLFCYILFDSGGTFNTDVFYLTLDGGEFALIPVSGRSECFKKESDLSREGKPCGSVILNSRGECVGLLTLTVEDRKVLPLFLPIPENGDAARGGKRKNVDCEVLQKGPESSAKEEHPSEGDKIVIDKSEVPTCTTVDSNMAPDNGTMDENLASSLMSNVDAHMHLRSLSHNLPTHHDQASMHAVQEGSDPGDDVSFPARETTGPEPLKQLEPIGEVLCSGKAISYQRSQSEIPSSSDVAASVRGDMVSRSISYSFPPAYGHLERLYPNSLLSKAIVSRIYIMDKLAEYLNTQVCPKGVNMIQCWLHLAELYNVPEDVKMRCQQCISASSNLFEYLCVCEPISIGILKQHLKYMFRNDVLDELRKANLPDSATIKDLCDAHPQTLGRMCVKLDHGLKNWRDLGQRLGLAADKLIQFAESTDCKPAEVILVKIQTKSPKTPIKEIKDELREMDRGDVCREALDELKDDATITTLYHNYEIWEKVIQLLQIETKGVKNWETLAYKHGIPKDVCDSLKPSCQANPTKSILEFIVQTDPDVTVKDFIQKLRAMEREDVVDEVLKKFFYAEDIDRIAIVRQLQAE